MRTTGVVSEWHDELGWGVVRLSGGAGDCWVHFSAVEMDGYRALAPGTRVSLGLEPGQDGYAHRGVEVRPAEPGGAGFGPTTLPDPA